MVWKIQFGLWLGTCICVAWLSLLSGVLVKLGIAVHVWTVLRIVMGVVEKSDWSSLLCQKEVSTGGDRLGS